MWEPQNQDRVEGKIASAYMESGGGAHISHFHPSVSTKLLLSLYQCQHSLVYQWDEIKSILDILYVWVFQNEMYERKEKLEGLWA